MEEEVEIVSDVARRRRDTIQNHHGKTTKIRSIYSTLCCCLLLHADSCCLCLCVNNTKFNKKSLMATRRASPTTIPTPRHRLLLLRAQLHHCSLQLPPATLRALRALRALHALCAHAGGLGRGKGISWVERPGPAVGTEWLCFHPRGSGKTVSIDRN